VQKSVIFSILLISLITASCGPLTVQQLTLRAEKGDPQSQYQLARRLDLGAGIQEDPEAAARWYQKAADTGYAEAEYRLGTFYQFGRAVKQDYVKAMAYYKKASDKKYPPAVTAIGVMYDLGLGVNENNMIAVEYFSRGADLFHSPAMLNLAMMHAQGEGVRRDLIQAFMWSETGLYFANQPKGDTSAVEALLKLQMHLKGKLTEIEVSNARRGMQLWVESRRKRKTERPPGTDPTK
jgi:TPR repeat protein